MRQIVAGLAIAFAGLVLRAWSVRCLLRAGLSKDQILLPMPPPRYTDEGPYALMPHPAYWGSLAIFAGLGIACFGPAGWLFALTAWPFYRSRMIEEDRLRAASP